MPKSDSYQEYLIKRLQNPEEAAGYLWAILQEEDPEPQLLAVALNDVAEALGETKLSPEVTKLHREKIAELMSKNGSQAIYGLAEWLKVFGLELTVAVVETDEANREVEEDEIDSEVMV
ncbi:MAG: transcriptional regulator [Oscillatoria sp. PMC 1068.18]|nr:transcriptional regulator [Oscillatoria sp. PMC 1076.18]MEC4988695.1 transcriptional regulator [Oscillatoria sp. PMC 1068.18]